jgi:site-specific recombinase XerC
MTLMRSLDVAAIVDRHRASRVALLPNDPRVRDVMAGLRPRRGRRPLAKAPLSLVELGAMVEVHSATVFGVRDRALLLMGLAAALRRAELVVLDVDHIARHRYARCAKQDGSACRRCRCSGACITGRALSCIGVTHVARRFRMHHR